MGEICEKINGVVSTYSPTEYKITQTGAGIKFCGNSAQIQQLHI